MGSITKKGERHIRRPLGIRMTSQVQRALEFPDRAHPRILKLLERRPIRLATIAMANKAARVGVFVLNRRGFTVELLVQMLGCFFSGVQGLIEVLLCFFQRDVSDFAV